MFVVDAGVIQAGAQHVAAANHVHDCRLQPASAPTSGIRRAGADEFVLANMATMTPCTSLLAATDRPARTGARVAHFGAALDRTRGAPWQPGAIYLAARW
jgi:hypothetical protein